METDLLLDIDLSGLSLRHSLELDGLFFSPESSVLLHDLLQVEDMLMHEDAHSDCTVSGTPLRQSKEADCTVRHLEAGKEQSYALLLGGVALSRPAACSHSVAFGTESQGANRLVILQSVFRPAAESTFVPIAGAVTTLTFAASEEYVCFGYRGGGMGLVRCATADAPCSEPNYFPNWHQDDMRDCALMSGTHQHQIATGSYDGTVCISDLLQGVPLLSMALGTSVSSVAAHPRHPQVLSCTADAGAAFVRDLRVGRRGQNRHSDLAMIPLSDTFEETRGLLDHAWTAEYQCMLAYGTGSLVTVDSRNSQTLSNVTCRTRLDSVEYHAPSSTLAVFGTGCSLYTATPEFEPFERARYRPHFDRTEGNAGVFDEAGNLFITAPDSSLMMLETR